MLKNLVLEGLKVRLKKGAVLPMDGQNVKYNELSNWSGDTHVLDTVDYIGLHFELVNKEGLKVTIDKIDDDDNELEPNAKIIEFKDNNQVVIQTKEGITIEGYTILGDIYDGEYISIYGADERHSKENNYEGSPLDIYVKIDALVKYFEVI